MQIEQLAMDFLEGVGKRTANRILEAFGKAENFFKATEKECREAGFSEKACNGLQALREKALNQARLQMEECRQRGIWIISREEETYPSSLKMCPDAPLVIYGLGRTDMNLERGVAVVGTRHASLYGKSQARKIVEGLADCTDGIVSGMALGIDAEAHRTALDCGLYTIAVMGPGLDNLYPPENLPLAQKILEAGGSIISEIPVNTPPYPGLFPRRNRIIAGLAVATVLAEGALKSGGIITARLADEYQRMVFAVPGRNDMHYQEGCNHLIACGKALLVRHADDIKRGLGWDYAQTDAVSKGTSATGKVRLKDPAQADIMRILEIENPAPWDMLMLQSNQEAHILSATLLKMEIAGLIRSLPGNFYEKV